MKLALSILLLSCSGHCLSQERVRTILDKENNSPVPYATVKVLHTSKGELSNEKGEFLLNIESTDSVSITSIGYKQRIIPAREISSIIYLDRLSKVLQNVVLRETVFLRTIILGNGKDFLNTALKCRYTGTGEKDGCWPWGPSGKKEEFAEKIIIPDSSRSYKLIRAYIPTRKANHYGPLLLRIYAEDPVSGLPGEELFVKLVKIEADNIHKNKVVIELGRDNIYINQIKAFFISMGWPPATSYYMKGLKGPTALSLFETDKEYTYSRYLASDTYYWYSFGLMRDVNSQQKRIGTAYAIVLEERIYK